ncbi:arginine decarboxylase [Fluviicola chungangensis]|jgi:arginine decarboxylase|uniref:Arginine decarboxylase n=1 Tax=Fluviicola chungangensis TaxID=2597671 RepID=A0A556MZX8_9FLAO|nr:arginine decarboxylase [Fluviicola chungangensis]TSJ45480.1 arginine decarboxylase [Fluviicola chungangensis]
MRTKYIDLIDQTFDFPQDEFHLREDRLMFHGIDLMRLIEEYGTPLKFNYLPQISHNIQRAKGWFREAMNNLGYSGNYYYSYCTKSSHFSFVLDEVLKNDVHIETSSAFDIDIVKNVLNAGKLKEGSYVICNGFKPPQYIQNIADLIDDKRLNVIPVVDNTAEIHDLIAATGENELKIGIRIASEEEPKFEFYTSRLGIRYREIVPFYKAFIQDNPRVQIKMLHFFINTGINDTSYYWNELTKCLRIYSDLKKVCPTLDSLNIGGGFPIKKSLAFDFDYAYMVREILMQVKRVCSDNDIPEPNIYTEFGSFTVGESGGAIFNVLHQKQQNDREKWNMIDSSFMTNLPDTWAINQRFIMLAINRWNDDYERVLLGGLTCDSDDYYNSEQHSNAIYLPKFDKNKPLYIGFFNTGAYQETIGGYGGLKHCLIPEPKHVLIQRDEHGKIVSELFSKEQTADDFMRILGYQP